MEDLFAVADRRCDALEWRPAGPSGGQERVSRFFIGIQPRQPADAQSQFTQINGRLGVLMISDGKIYHAIAFELAGDRVRNIYIVRNPEKLRHLPVSPKTRLVYEPESK